MDKDNILKRASGFKVEGKKTKPQAWQELEKKMNKMPTAVTNNYQKLFIGSAAAAIAAILLVFTFVNRTTTYKTLAGDTQMITLPDNSLAYLNAGTTLKVTTGKWPSKREVILDGEAFFEVIPGSSFTVRSANGTVKVLGTKFNVYSRNSFFMVDCYSGKVNVTNAHQDQSVNLLPNTGIRLKEDNRFSEKYTIKPQRAKSWLTGVFHFKATPLILVIEEIERQFGYTVEIKTDISNRSYTGSFTNKDLAVTLDLVCVPMGLKYNIVEAEKRVTIQ
ncbi:DUF4974 domain-containing protein [Marinilabiliaceae bacterium JC017]|nr:DUF4974 domain-containing protein [Marinilabiliaceae bacterium JC017]